MQDISNLKDNHMLSIYEDKNIIYNIFIEPTFEHLKDTMNPLNVSNKKLCIVADTNTAKYYLQETIDILNNVAKKVTSFVFNAGEQSKNLNTVSGLYETLIYEGFDRGDLLVALGGGVVGDLTGFTAATYLRGISFVQIPTSLLAMCDSSIGGKTGVDLNAYKNMVGAFHQPSAVYMNVASLNSLPKREFYSGFAEIIKHGFIKDRSFLQWLIEHNKELLNMSTDALQSMIYQSCHIKKEVVEKDPKEQGERALLNFGHTIGHAVEKLKNFSLLHGECVSIGMVAAATISLNRCYITKEEYTILIETLKAFQLPVTVSGLDAQEVLTITQSDKKMLEGKIKFVLLNGLGNAIIDNTVTNEEILDAIESIINKER